MKLDEIQVLIKEIKDIQMILSHFEGNSKQMHLTGCNLPIIFIDYETQVAVLKLLKKRLNKLAKDSGIEL